MPSLAILPITNNYTVGVNDGIDLYQVNPTSSMTITLCSAVGSDGLNFYFKREDNVATRIVTIVAPGGQTIDGQSSQPLGVKRVIHLNAYNGNWWVIGN